MRPCKFGILNICGNWQSVKWSRWYAEIQMNIKPRLEKHIVIYFCLLLTLKEYQTWKLFLNPFIRPLSDLLHFQLSTSIRSTHIKSTSTRSPPIIYRSTPTRSPPITGKSQPLAPHPLDLPLNDLQCWGPWLFGPGSCVCWWAGYGETSSRFLSSPVTPRHLSSEQTAQTRQNC